MSADLLQVLVDMTLTSSAALLLVGLLRKPMRVAVGTRAAYWLWLLVPTVMVAMLIPAPSLVLSSTQVILPSQIRSALSIATVSEAASGRSGLVTVALTIWAVGATAMLVAVIWRQRSFVRSLGVLRRDASGLYRCDGTAAPMLIGVWRPKIVVPADFESRYSPTERELVLAHERAHESRHDVVVNAVASIALCLCWFNPLLYRAIAWLRMDQELACDALVISRRGEARRRYADALLKTQLANDSALSQPLGCHWQSIHPLKERINMLKHPLPSRSRRTAGLAFITALIGTASYTAWANQSRTDGTPSILVDLKVTISNTQTNEVKALATQYLVHSGEAIKDANGHALPFACTPYVPDEPGRSTDWSDQRARGIPLPAAGQILLDCVIRQDGKVVQRPALIVEDGKLGTVESAESGGPHTYRFDVTASTSPEKIAAARKQTAK